ncbi:MAG: hypothetical protein KAU60_11000, partial [Desulfobacterales bacterium]|nr:hypothetical protein [Desulfobacterales bacterium]
IMFFLKSIIYNKVFQRDFFDRINRIFWIFYFSQSPDETEKAQSRPRAGKGNLASNPCYL